MRARSSSSKLRVAAVIITLAAAAAIALLVACPPASRPRPAAGPPAAARVDGGPDGTAQLRPAAAPPRRVEPEGRLAVILDDAGYSLDELEPFLELPGPLTVAVLPNLPHSAEAARRVLAAGKELILHCPMEAEGDENPGPGALRVGMSQAEIDRLLDADFASVPGAAGMNNHMGSRATADPALMEAVLGYLRRTGRFYVDSRTTALTVGPEIARTLGVPFAQRNVFIDDERSEKAIADAFEAGIQEARARGSLVVIGHVQNRGVLDILRAGRTDLAENGVRLVRLSEIIAGPARESALFESPGN